MTKSKRVFLGAAWLSAAWVAAAGAATPAAGDTYLYRLVNGYNAEPLGQVRYRVEKVEPGRVTLAVSPEGSATRSARTVVTTGEGNWLQHEVESHGNAVEYVFDKAYPAYVFPLDPGKSWSVRVPAKAPGANKSSRSVRVDGKVIGTERIRVPAGEFETVKVRRLVYAGDHGDPHFAQNETQITEIDWYAPALGRPVRTERRSGWLDMSQCSGRDGGGCEFRGNWDIYELVEAPGAKR
jgi:hypothetical protein